MKDIIGYEGLYAVTREGLVWAYPKKSRLQGRWLKSTINRFGYEYVCLFKDGKRKNRYVHQLVAEAYVGERLKPHVNHIDGNKLNNHADNLEWVTPKENKIHAFSTGLTKIKQSQIEASRRNIIKYNLSKGIGHVGSSSIQ